ncbi:sulfotransferase, partial [Candidatus Parcubacteria bacterium]|nr:sulfotransferase [Candidatus Parcubacteria bacterium]
LSWGLLFSSANFLIKKISKPKKLVELLNAWCKAQKNIKTKIYSILLMFGILATYSLRLFLLYEFFNISISIPAILLIVSLAILSFFVSITPAALGIREGIMIAAAYLSGYKYVDTAIVATADRALVFCVILLLNVFIGLFFLSRKLSPYNFTIRYLNKWSKSIPSAIKRALTRLWLAQIYFRPRLGACKKPIFILGNQKSGTTVIASLLARATGRSLAIDLRQEILSPSFEKLKSKQLSMDEFINKNILDFSKEIIKVPELSFFYNELSEHCREAKYIFIVRDPRDNISSLLNRLNTPGHLEVLEASQIKKLPLAWQLVFRVDWLGEENSESYIKNLSTRWLIAANNYLQNKDKIVLVKFEDFLSDKADTIERLAAKCGLSKVNDISGLVDKQFQPHGDRKTSWLDFYGKANLGIIEETCGQAMKELGY